MFAALNTVEPPIVERSMVGILERDEPWYAQRLPAVEQRVRHRLAQLSRRLGDAQWLDGAFSAGDLLMATVLLRARPTGLLDGYPSLCAYLARAEARPGYRRAFAAQLAVFNGTQG
jgi:glutathione S-transferase